MQHKYLASLVAGLFALPAQGQEIPLLDQIVVTATRVPTPVSEVLADVSVVGAEEIRHAGQATLVEFLQTLPGVEINQIGGAGSTSSLFIRGGNAQHTLVLVDGVPMTSATLGSTRLEHLPLALVERIEVVRGPMSHLYGSEAMAGVVQIFTRQGTPQPVTSLSLGTGGFGRAQAEASLTGTQGSLRYALAAGHDEQTGFSAKKAPNDPDKDGYRNSHALLNLSWQLDSSHALVAHAITTSAKTEFDDGAAPYDSHSRARISTAGLALKSDLGAWSSRFSADLAREAVYTQGNFFGAYSSQIDMDRWSLAWQLDGQTALGQVQSLLEHQDWDIDGDVAYSVTSRERDVVMLGWQNTFSGHGLQANLRHDDDSQFGGHTTGMLGYGWSFLPGWRAVATLATAYRAPAFDDLYWPGSGNPNLKPEEARNREVGVRYRSARAEAGLIAYRNDVSELIQWAPTGLGGAWQPSNVASARLRGATLSGKRHLGAFTLRGSVDWQDPQDTGTGNLLILRAKRHAALGLDYRKHALNLSLDWLLQDKRYNDAANTVEVAGYGVVHLALGYQVAEDWTLNARVENLFDKAYERSSGYNTPERSLFVSLRYQPR